MNKTTASTQSFKVVAMVLILAGVLLLTYGGYVYATDSTSNGVLGNVAIGDQEVSVPIVGGLVITAVGIALVFLGNPSGPLLPRTPNPHVK